MTLPEVRDQTPLKDILVECFRHFVHLDQANAAIHCAPVRYSPITFRLAEQLFRNTEMPVPTEVEEVIDHLGRYSEDIGR